VTRETQMRERLDAPVAPPVLAAALEDLRRLNAWFGGYSVTLARVRRAEAGLAPGRRLLVVDVGGGRGDLAIHVVRWARRRGRPVRVVVLDADPGTLALARRHTIDYPEIVLVRADASALPLREGAADIAVAALILHHLTQDEAVVCLASMAAAASLVIVNDLLRTRATLMLVWLASRLLCVSPVARQDGLLSVRRAYSAQELGWLAEEAGVSVQIRRYPWLARLVAEIGDSTPLSRSPHHERHAA
jgi:2-polyprenyl-3-methyl-5-hydroxy-6-metoxy-1,4-benzoquinol methylase